MIKKLFNLNYYLTLLIVFIGGFIEIYSFKTRGMFAGMQTGNLLYTITNLIDQNYINALMYFLVLLSFIIGLVIAEILRLFLGKKDWFYILILIIQSVLVLPLIILPSVNVFSEFNNEILLSLLGNCLLSIYGAFHLLCFHEVNEHVYTPTMMTNMMRLFITSLISSIKEKDKEKCLFSLSYFIQICSFILGAILFYVLYVSINSDYLEYFIKYSPLLLVLINLIIIIILLIKNISKYKSINNQTK